MYYNMIVNFPTLHVHVLDLKPFEVGLGHIGLTRHHGCQATMALRVVHPLPSTKILKEQKEKDTTNTSTPKTCNHQ
jgi:hypothetical protein